MADEQKDEEKEETLESEEGEEKKPESEEKKPQPPPKEEEIIPETRFTSQKEEKPVQSKTEKILGYKLRKAHKKLKESGLLDEDEDEDLELGKVDEQENEVIKKLNDIESKTASEGLLHDFLSQNPEYGKYEKKIRAHINHPAYANIPIGFIAKAVAGEEIAAERISKKAEADKEAEETQSGGDGVRKIPGKLPDFKAMTKEQFEAYQNQVRQKGRR